MGAQGREAGGAGFSLLTERQVEQQNQITQVRALPQTEGAGVREPVLEAPAGHSDTESSTGITEVHGKVKMPVFLLVSFY